MSLTWSEIAFRPDAELAAEWAAAWRWLLPDTEAVLVCSMFGGVFFTDSAGAVHWLECGTGFVEQVAVSAEQFDGLLTASHEPPGSSLVSEWFLPFLVEQLLDAGKRPEPGQCYGLTILPVFEGGTYSVDNTFVVSAGEWLSHTGEVHQQLAALPDGTRVQLKVID